MSRKSYAAVNRVAIFFAANLARSAFSSDNFLSTKPSPLHSEHKPEPPQSSHVIKGTWNLKGNHCISDNPQNKSVEKKGSNVTQPHQLKIFEFSKVYGNQKFAAVKDLLPLDLDIWNIKLKNLKSEDIAK